MGFDALGIRDHHQTKANSAQQKTKTVRIIIDHRQATKKIMYKAETKRIASIDLSFIGSQILRDQIQIQICLLARGDREQQNRRPSDNRIIRHSSSIAAHNRINSSREITGKSRRSTGEWEGVSRKAGEE